MAPQEPGSFTRIIAAMVMPRKTSRETTRPGRGVAARAGAPDEGATIDSAVAMESPSDGGIVQQRKERCNAGVTRAMD